MQNLDQRLPWALLALRVGVFIVMIIWTLRERLALRAHLFMCRICRNYEQQLELIRTAMTRLGERPLDGEGLSPEARERIRGRLDAGGR